ncbi:hypothetical protein [Pseudoduganella lutea]|nr:hypothetical protein [Pseudoduganella lutea]
MPANIDPMTGSPELAALHRKRHIDRREIVKDRSNNAALQNNISRYL